MNVRSVLASTLLLILSVLWPYGLARAENWPAWRGPRGDGSSVEKHLPDRWNGPRGENIAWKAEIPGKGHASPIVWNDRVFVVSCREESEQRLLLCLERTSGRILWERVVLRAPLERKNPLNSYASLERTDRFALQRLAGRGGWSRLLPLRSRRDHDYPTWFGIQRGVQKRIGRGLLRVTGY